MLSKKKTTYKIVSFEICCQITYDTGIVVALWTPLLAIFLFTTTKLPNKESVYMFDGDFEMNLEDVGGLNKIYTV